LPGGAPEIVTAYFAVQASFVYAKAENSSANAMQYAGIAPLSLGIAVYL